MARRKRRLGAVSDEFKAMMEEYRREQAAELEKKKKALPPAKLLKIMEKWLADNDVDAKLYRKYTDSHVAFKIPRTGVIFSIKDDNFTGDPRRFEVRGGADEAGLTATGKKRIEKLKPLGVNPKFEDFRFDQSEVGGVLGRKMVTVPIEMTPDEVASKILKPLSLDGLKQERHMGRKKRSRSHLGQTDLLAPGDRSSRVVGLSTAGKLTLAAVAGLGIWYFFFSKKAVASENVKSVEVPTGAATGGTATGGSGKVFKDPGSGVVITGPSGPILTAEDKYDVKRGESWSNIASRTYGDYRWWPALWDANRAGVNAAKYSDPAKLREGDLILVPRLPTNNEAFKKAIFARAEADRKWELAVKKKGAKAAGPRPKSTYAPTPAPVSALPPASSAASMNTIGPATAAEAVSPGTAQQSGGPPAVQVVQSTESQLDDLESSMRSDLFSR